MMDEAYCLFFSSVLILIMLYARKAMDGNENILISIFSMIGIFGLSVAAANALFVFIGIIICVFNIRKAMIDDIRKIGK